MYMLIWDLNDANSELTYRHKHKYNGLVEFKIAGSPVVTTLNVSHAKPIEPLN